ncbi:MAG: HYR domain-containing protein, partial [Nitrosotalea sp.]
SLGGNGAGITNTGTIVVQNGAIINNDGYILNNQGGAINDNSDGLIQNPSDGTINNNGGTISNFGGTLENGGTLLNSGGTFAISGGTLDNGNTFTVSGGTLAISGGTLENLATLTISSSSLNISGGQLENFATLDNNQGSTIATFSGGTINNLALISSPSFPISSPPAVFSVGTFNNNGAVNNQGVFNNGGGSLVISGSLDNIGTINNSNETLTNRFGTATHHGTITVVSGGTLFNIGTISNSDTIDNFNTFTNSVGGNILTLQGGTINNSVLTEGPTSTIILSTGSFNNFGNIINDGTLSNLGGTFTNSQGLSGPSDSGGIISNPGGNLTNDGSIDNSDYASGFTGTVISQGTFLIQATSTVDNRGTISNHNHSLTNDGTLGNCGTITGKISQNQPVDCTTTIVTPNPASVSAGDTVQYGVSVTDNATPASTPASTVSWSDNRAGGTFTSSGSCTLSGSANRAQCAITYTSPSAGGAVTINAAYGGDAIHSKSSGTSELSATKPTDVIPPKISISEPSNNILNHILSVNGTASDDTSVSSVIGKIDIGPVSAATTSDDFAHWSFATLGLSNGLHHIQINATDSAGLVTTQAISITVDNAPPIVTGIPSIAANANGWYNIPIQVTWAGTDLFDTITSCDPVATYAGPDGSNIVLSGQCTDQAGNTGTGTLTINYDATPPTINGAPTTSANSNGWYDTNVTVHFVCSDATSGISTCTPDQTLSTEGKSQQVTGTATDKAGNIATMTVSGINIDKTPPVTTATPSGTLGSNGWFKSTVEITLTGADNLSGVTDTSYSLDGGPQTTYSGPFTVIGDSNHTLTFNSTDNAGNAESPKTLHVAIDATLPTVTGTANMTANSNGWYNHPLQISWSGTDATSGITSCDSPTVYSGPDGSSISITGKCTDNAGNVGTSTVTIKYDSTPPVLTVPSSIAVLPTGPSGAIVTFSSTNGTAASATDATSGLAGIAYSLPSGSTFPIGATTVTATASDNAGNTATETFTVTVLTPAGAIQQIINNISSMNLDHGTMTSLDAKLNAAISSLNSGDGNTAKNQLSAFINEVNALAGKKITQDDADKLIAAAQNIINSIS